VQVNLDNLARKYGVEKKRTSKYIGVSYNKKNSKWNAQRRSKEDNKVFSYGHYDDEITAAHASDTLTRKLMKNCKRKLKLNFPDNHNEVYPEQCNQNKKKGTKD